MTTSATGDQLEAAHMPTCASECRPTPEHSMLWEITLLLHALKDPVLCPRAATLAQWRVGQPGYLWVKFIWYKKHVYIEVPQACSRAASGVSLGARLPRVVWWCVRTSLDPDRKRTNQPRLGRQAGRQASRAPSAAWNEADGLMVQLCPPPRAQPLHEGSCAHLQLQVAALHEAQSRSARPHT